MNSRQLKNLLVKVRNREASVSEALNRLKHFPVEELGFAMIDHHRTLRQGFPEVVLCQGKTDRQILTLIRRSLEQNPRVLATRAAPATFEKIAAEFPAARYNELGRTVILTEEKASKRRLAGCILIVTAGTSDLGVAEEARETALLLGSRVETVYDAGVAGIHRFLAKKTLLYRARVVVVIAGMDGVLASVVGGLTDRPLIAVPTSQGYGASFHGIAPLLTMLNSCSSGIGVMNIDNGFGAAVLAHRINRLKR